MTIGTLLKRTQTEIVRVVDDTEMVRSRADLTRHLLASYADYHALRLHLFHGHALAPSTRALSTLLAAFEARRWVVIDGSGGRRVTLDRISPDEERYLRGHWLEELVYLAHLEAGCDEALLGVKLEWVVNGIVGYNEIDVIARRGSTLSFTSCKCVRPVEADHAVSLRPHLLEADYWNRHFADGDGRAVLAVTADVYDERCGNRLRYPALHARADVVDVEFVGLEDLRWDTLVDRLHAHWSL